jgi:tRNA nucleotidyltransferase/poly(A) polymerase
MKLTDLLGKIAQIAKSMGSTAFICGGTPRDLFMHRRGNVVDIDITTGDKLVNSLADACYRQFSKTSNVQFKASNDGHRSIYFANIKIDFSSNFQVPNVDLYLQKAGLSATGVNRETISRDFTCNSMLCNLDFSKIIDPLGVGKADISKKIVRTNLAPEITLTTNKNRAIRAIYLAIKLGFDLAPELKTYIIKNPEIVNFASNNALVGKVDYIFQADPQRAKAMISELGLWGHIPITRAARPYHTLDVRAYAEPARQPINTTWLWDAGQNPSIFSGVADKQQVFHADPDGRQPGNRNFGFDLAPSENDVGGKDAKDVSSLRNVDQGESNIFGIFQRWLGDEKAIHNNPANGVKNKDR